MRRTGFIILITTLLIPMSLRAQVEDSVDVKDYDVTMDLSHSWPFEAYADLTVELLRPCATIRLDFVGTVDSVKINGVTVESPDMEALPTAGIATGEDFHIEVWYHGRRYIESYGWGGFHFDSDMNYNLGVGFEADPHVMGRVLMPCRDNFHDKATYTFHVKTKAGWTAECGGMLQSRVTNADGTESSVWRIAQQTPTYLVSVSQAAWKRIYDSIPSLYGTYPATYGYLYPDSTQVRQVFAELDSVVPMFERCFGPYRWGRIGYIATNKGSMEHVNNIGLAKQALTTMEEFGQSTIAHELGHAWFGNLVTCSTSGDMWINEGGASFTSEVAWEAVHGREASDDYYQRHLEEVLRTTHITDAGYRALHDMPHEYTYGSTTYKKGWMVWHSLRGYLGETVFYNAIQRLMRNCAFGNLDAYQLRDSLSLYTGVDLTDFFDFHVFSPGFVDYRVELIPGDTPAVNIRQQAVGTTNEARGSMVPITFFGTDGTTTKGTFPVGTSTLGVPNNVAFCVLDRDCEFSDAATVIGNQVGRVGRDTLPLVHMMVGVESFEGNPKPYYVEHHMAPSLGELPEGVVRRANRYWMVRGELPENAQGFFRYVRAGYSDSKYKNLDRGFYKNRVTLDSMAILYRPSVDSSWRVVPGPRTGSPDEGWMVCGGLQAGEYTLAVVNPELLSVDRPQSVEAQLFPNPLKKGQPLTVEVDSEEPFTVTIFDEGGRQVWQKTGCRNGQKLRPRLEKGTYFVRIENNFISLHSKLIQL